MVGARVMIVQNHKIGRDHVVEFGHAEQQPSIELEVGGKEVHLVDAVPDGALEPLAEVAQKKTRKSKKSKKPTKKEEEASRQSGLVSPVLDRLDVPLHPRSRALIGRCSLVFSISTPSTTACKASSSALSRTRRSDLLRRVASRSTRFRIRSTSSLQGSQSSASRPERSSCYHRSNTGLKSRSPNGVRRSRRGRRSRSSSRSPCRSTSAREPPSTQSGSISPPYGSAVNCQSHRDPSASHHPCPHTH